MGILDHFGNEIEVGDEVAFKWGEDMWVVDITDIRDGVAYSLNTEVASLGPNHSVYLNVSKKEKEGAMKYHLLNSQIDGGS